MWTLKELAPAASAELALKARVNAGTAGKKIVMAIGVACDQPDPVPGNSLAKVGILVKGGGAPVADLDLSASADNVVPSESERVTYTLTVANMGPDAATHIRVSDPLPAGVTFQKSSSPAYANGVWAIASLTPGTAARLMVEVAVEPGTEHWIITNSVKVASVDQQDPNDANNAAEAKIAVHLIERFAEAVQAAMMPTTTERQPISPTRPLWR